MRAGRTRSAAGLAVVALALFVGVAWAANPAALDPSFSDDGKRAVAVASSPQGTAQAVVVEPNGRVVVGGPVEPPGADTAFGLARLKQNGSLDPTFSADGIRLISFGSNGADLGGLARQPDGKIVAVGGVVGGSPGNNDFAVARLTTAGGLDPSFSGNGKVTTDFTTGDDYDIAYGVAVQPNGRIVVAGYSYRASDGYRFALARYMPNGSLDRTFSGNGKLAFGFPGRTADDEGSAVALQSDGRIVVAGHSDQGDATGYDFAVARLLANGGFDPSFTGDGKLTSSLLTGHTYDQANAVALDGARIVVAGVADSDPSSADDQRVFGTIRLRMNGTRDPSFSQDGERTDQFGGDLGFANAVATLPNGKILVAGTDYGPTDNHFVLIRYRSNGTRDPSFSGNGWRFTDFPQGPYDAANAIDVGANGRIVLAGSTADGVVVRFAVARYLGGP